MTMPNTSFCRDSEQSERQITDSSSGSQREKIQFQQARQKGVSEWRKPGLLRERAAQSAYDNTPIPHPELGAIKDRTRQTAHLLPQDSTTGCQLG